MNLTNFTKNKSSRTLTVLASLTLLISISVSFFPTATSAQDKTPVYSTPLGIALESYPYPYPVQYLPLEVSGLQRCDSQPQRNQPYPVQYLPLETLGQSVRMAYMDVPPSGKDNGQVVMLLHGKNFYGSYWENTIKALSKAGYRVVVPDQIGFGKSAKPDIDYSFALLAANTAQLLDKLKVDKVAVVGYSMGGMLAVRFARDFPERTTYLVLENPIGLEDYRFKVPPQTTQQLVESELKQTTEAIRAFYKNYFVTWNPEQYEQFVEVPARVRLSGEFPRYALASALTYQMSYQQPVRQEFGLIQQQTLLVIGQEDRSAIGKNLVPDAVANTLGQYPDLGRAAEKDIPNSKLVELENVGHIPVVLQKLGRW